MEKRERRNREKEARRRGGMRVGCGRRIRKGEEGRRWKGEDAASPSPSPRRGQRRGAARVSFFHWRVLTGWSFLVPLESYSSFPYRLS